MPKNADWLRHSKDKGSQMLTFDLQNLTRSSVESNGYSLSFTEIAQVIHANTGLSRVTVNS